MERFPACFEKIRLWDRLNIQRAFAAYFGPHSGRASAFLGRAVGKGSDRVAAEVEGQRLQGTTDPERREGREPLVHNPRPRPPVHWMADGESLPETVGTRVCQGIMINIAVIKIVISVYKITRLA